jgi:N-acetylglucosamine-6-sulfatase
VRPSRNALLIAMSAIAIVAGLAFPARAEAPSVTGFDPTSGAIGSSVTIAGSGFRGATDVTFNGASAARFSIDSDAQITATVPAGATTGPISVVTPEGTATSADGFTATNQNIVLILSDDQRYDSLQYMPNVESDLVSHGVTFTNAFDNNPLCCPSRTSIMTGQTSGHNGVWFNGGSSGGFSAFKPHANQTIFTWLHGAGYRTAMIGKFLNGYQISDVPWTAPGVDEWDAMLLDKTNEGTTGCDRSGYWATCYSHDGTLETHSSSDYSTTVVGQKAVDFIGATPADQALFLYLAPRAPHLPTIPETRYASACPQVQPLRPPSYNRPIVNGPAYMNKLKNLSAQQRANLDTNWQNDCRTLLSVDDQVANVIQALSASGRLANTLIMYASDNGFLFGEHRYHGKIVPYDESIRVPVVVRDDALGTNGTSDAHAMTNMDYTGTFLQAAGLAPVAGYQFDGQSLLPLAGGSGSWTTEDEVLIEHSGGKKVPAYCGVRTPDWMFTHYATGEEELYNMTSDANELTNVAGDSANAATIAALRADTRRLCDPTPPGFAW